MVQNKYCSVCGRESNKWAKPPRCEGHSFEEMAAHIKRGKKSAEWLKEDARIKKEKEK